MWHLVGAAALSLDSPAVSPLGVCQRRQFHTVCKDPLVCRVGECLALSEREAKVSDRSGKQASKCNILL